MVNWYGYFADRDQALIADSTATTKGSGLDFGTFCSADTADTWIGVSVTDTVGVAVPSNVAAATNGTNPAAITADCSGTTTNGN